MTSSVTVHTNGDYVSEGTMTILPADGGAEQKSFETIKVGPGQMRQQSFYYPHGHRVVVELAERQATEDEVATAKVEGRYYAVADGNAGQPQPQPKAEAQAEVAAAAVQKGPAEQAYDDKAIGGAGQQQNGSDGKPDLT
jgi:hypothetical protein